MEDYTLLFSQYGVLLEGDLGRMADVDHVLMQLFTNKLDDLKVKQHISSRMPLTFFRAKVSYPVYRSLGVIIRER